MMHRDVVAAAMAGGDAFPEDILDLEFEGGTDQDEAAGWYYDCLNELWYKELVNLVWDATAPLARLLADPGFAGAVRRALDRRFESFEKIPIFDHWISVVAGERHARGDCGCGEVAVCPHLEPGAAPTELQYTMSVFRQYVWIECVKYRIEGGRASPPAPQDVYLGGRYVAFGEAWGALPGLAALGERSREVSARYQGRVDAMLKVRCARVKRLYKAVNPAHLDRMAREGMVSIDSPWLFADRAHAVSMASKGRLDFDPLGTVVLLEFENRPEVAQPRRFPLRPGLKVEAAGDREGQYMAVSDERFGLVDGLRLWDVEFAMVLVQWEMRAGSKAAPDAADLAGFRERYGKMGEIRVELG